MLRDSQIYQLILTYELSQNAKHTVKWFTNGAENPPNVFTCIYVFKKDWHKVLLDKIVD